jgi:nucleolar protein 9
MKACGLSKLCMYVSSVYLHIHGQEYSFFLSHQGLFVTLACTKHGSRSLDAIWDVANLKQKILIMDELSTKEPILNSDRYGSILATNYCLSLYKHSPNEWKDLQGKEFHKKKLFADIIGDSKKSS